ncbi:MAG: S8 family serine peptidase [Bacteroidota bacterium]|nr:S8 family serine peptidase [Bacteroidota bacterium]
MMRWNIALNIFLFTFPLAFSQTYIVKFKTDKIDSVTIYSTINTTLKKAKTVNSQLSSFSFRSLGRKATSFNSTFPWKQFSVIKFPQKQNDQILQLLSADSLIEYIQPSYTYKVYSIPNDSAYSSQWNLRRIGIASLRESEAINSSLPNVKVGVIDTGIDDKHPDLINTIAFNPGEIGNGKETNGIDDDGNGFIDDWKGYDFVESESEDIGDWNERDNDPADENGHGTAVSGIIGAQTNNGIGLAGIFPVKILPLRAFGKNGNGNDIDIASAIVYAVDNGADVINLSFGDVTRSLILHDAIRYAYSKNVVLVASSGNDGTNYPHYPSDFSEVISTGSVSQFDSRSFFSSYSSSLDIMAPGEQIVTTTIGGGYIDQFAGTSAAAPHVSGVAAFLKSLEKQKKNNQPTYVERSNEEIRGILLNSADDVGEIGWDKFYGAGIVNAAKAIQMVSGSTVLIHSPGLDEILSENFKNIVISASTPYLQSVQLFYGRGENPTQWNLISIIENKILLQDTIQFLDKILLPNDFYILRLVVKNSKGNDVEFRQRIIIDSSQPKILSPSQFRDSVIIGNEYGGLVEVRVDRNCYGVLYYRKVGESQFKSMQSLGLQMNHTFVLSLKDLLPLQEYEFYSEFKENSSAKRSVRFPTIGYDTIKLRALPFNFPNFVQKPFTLPSGFLLNSVQTVNGKPTVILNQYNSEGDFGKLNAYQYQFIEKRFTAVDSSVHSWVPRSFVKNTGEGKSAVLVQDRGVSQLLQIDTISGKFFNLPVWGDSSDVWASQMVDLDDDNRPEIIARNSSEYLIYKNLGSNNFLLTTRLPNPSMPLFGDAKNQFGPPKSIVGDFTNSGKKEIIFTDYDGDLIMYRQTTVNTLNFEFAGIDSTNLYEMSDYITSGDFNGDGITDFAVLGHSNLDWNSDREYDAAVWKVRVFSHLQNDPSGKVSKIWEQDFVGVKAGSGYDNGICTLKRLTGGDRDELFLSLNPHGYIFSLNPIAGRFIPVFFHPSQSNSIVVYDFDFDGINDIGFNTNGKTEFWSSSFGNSNPSAPFALSIFPIDSTKIRLRWTSQTLNNKIYRGTHADSLLFSITISGVPEFVDSTVSINVKYFYSIVAVGTTESPQSSIVSITPHNAPVIDSVAQVSLPQLIVNFSYDISSDNLLRTLLLLDSNTQSSSIVWKSPRSVLATFPHTISVGNHSLRIRQMVDLSGMVADTNQSFSFFTTVQTSEEFFVRSIKLLSSNKIQIEFSEPFDFTTAKNILHYSVKTIARQYTITSVDSIQPESIVLTMVTGTNLSELALRLEVSISDSVFSSSGTRLNSGKGQTLSIAQETQSLDKIVVYPNPAKNSQQVSFVNIPKDCRITIYSMNGEKIKMFENVTTSEGISWNMKSENGNLVSTGVYLYRVEQLNDVNEITNTVLGKFAVIR